MLTLFFSFSLSTRECPIGTNYIYDQTINGTIQPNDWYYFMTSNTKTNQNPFYFTIECDNDVTVYQSKSADCPDDGDILILEAKKGKKNRVQLQVYNEYGFINIGIMNGPNPTKFVFSLSGQVEKKRFWTTSKKLIFLLMVMLSAVVAFFIYVTNPPQEHEKND